MILVCHGMGSVPEDFTDEASCQALADQEKVAILGVSGSSCEGKNRFVWKEKFEEDWQHLQMVLGEFTKEVTPAKGKCLAMGFSQGAQLSLELVSAHPDFFAGGIILGPGYMGAKRLEEALKAGGKPMADKKFFVAYYESEHPSTVAAAKNATKLLGAAGASVFHQAFQGRMHAPPPAFHQHLPLWVQILLQGKK